MNALYVVSHAVSSGPVNQALNILHGMKLNNKVSDTLVTIDAGDDKNNWISRFRENNINVTQLNIKSKYNIIKAVRELRKLIRLEDIDIVHCSGFRVNIICLLASKGLCNVVSTIRSEPSAVSELFPVILRPLVRKICIFSIKQIPVKVACSKAMQTIYNHDYNIKMECVQNGVDTNFFCPLSDEKKRLLRKKLGLRDARTFLVLGLLLPRKNNAIIIDAFKRVDSTFGNLIIVGGGPEEGALKKKAQDVSNILFVGQTDAPLEYIQSSDFLISASLAEGLPNTVLEAISCGLIPLLSDITPHKEIVDNTCVSHLFKRNSVEDLLRLLKEIKNWDLKDQSRFARELAMSNHGVRTLALQYEKIYEKAVIKN